MTHPKSLFIEIGTECNSNCKYCHMWMTRESDTALSTIEKLYIINQFKLLEPNGEVVLTGGETMLKYDEFISLSKECKKLGLICATNTNASLINNDNIDEILLNGPKYLVVSLDSHIEDVHNYNRGLVSDFKHVIDVLQKMIDRKKDISGCQVEIITNSVIFDKNISFLKDFIMFAEKMKIDGVMFQMLSRTFYKKTSIDYFFNEHFFKNKAYAINKIQEIIEIFDSHPIIRTSKRDLEWMKLYIDNPDFIVESVCDSYERNFIVDYQGNVKLCFNMSKSIGIDSVGNIRSQSIKDIWLSMLAEDARKMMSNCRFNCGMLNCHRKK